MILSLRRRKLTMVKAGTKGRGEIEVVDLFCGVGGLSHGLKRAGLKIKAGYDSDDKCKFAYEENNDSKFYSKDVSKVSASEIKSHFSKNAITVLAGCAPCQPFSSYKHRYKDDPRWNLVSKFANLVVQVNPDFVTMENVPTLLKYKKGAVFRKFCRTLEMAGYNIEWSVVKCEEFGVPQRRRRLVLIASKTIKITSLKPSKKKVVTVREAIGKLPRLRAGQSSDIDRLHVAASLSDLNLKRIKASRPGGTWHDWPKKLRSPCHRRETGETYSGVYARMEWDEPSPTMTTQCYGFGNGRFGHPRQNRAISLREAAILQSFPRAYMFVPKNEKVSISEVGKWIGNAVPVKLAEAIGKYIVKAVGSSYNER